MCIDAGMYGTVIMSLCHGFILGSWREVKSCCNGDLAARRFGGSIASLILVKLVSKFNYIYFLRYYDPIIIFFDNRNK